MEGMQVIDWGTEIAEKYGFEIKNARKGRGSWIFENFALNMNQLSKSEINKFNIIEP